VTDLITASQVVIVILDATVTSTDVHGKFTAVGLVPALRRRHLSSVA